MVVWNTFQSISGFRRAIKNKLAGGKLSSQEESPPHALSSPATTANTGKEASNSVQTSGSNATDPTGLHVDGTENPRKSIESVKSGRSYGSQSSGPIGGPDSRKYKLAGGERVPSLDLTIQFISACQIPKTDPTGKSDPYFKAQLDDVIAYTSTVQRQTLEPVWNEVWHVKNVPTDAVLRVKLYDKDENILKDDYIGDFAVTIGHGGDSEQDITGRFNKKHGKFKLNVIANPTNPKSTVEPYTFAGPCRFSRHKSPTIGAFTAMETDERLYATWKIYLMGIPDFFHDTHQHWNEKYPAAKKIFDHNPMSAAIRKTIHAGHKILYARTTANFCGILNRADDLIHLFRDETTNNRIKPCIYTYIINDDTWRFSETGAAFFVDFVSKHALHADVAQQVRYSGEFHWRPVVEGNWAGFHETNPEDDDAVKWELVIDNNSGTYSPDKNLLPEVKALIEYNFPGLKVIALDHSDPELKKSTDALHQYAKEHRGIGAHEFKAHEHLGSTTLKNVAAKMHIPVHHGGDKEDEQKQS